jgi:hypothetical protein
MNHKEEKAIEAQKIIHDIRNIVTSDEKTTLTVCSDDYDFINFSTRENGNVGDEEHSDIDYQDAKRIEKILLDKYRGKISTDIETVDEWVHLNIEIR